MAKKPLSEKARRKILTGSLWTVVLSVTLPLFVYQFINAFYSFADALMLVNISTTSSSAGAILAQVKNLISAFGAGIAGGGAILIARYFGAGEREKARTSANVMFTWELLVMVLILGVFLPLAVPIMRLCGCNDEIVAVSKGYFMLQLVEQCIICVNNAFIACEKSKGDTRLIFVGNILAMGVKLALNALFVFGLKVDNMVWVEVASIIAQLTMMGIAVTRLFSKSNPFQIAFKRLSLSWPYSKILLKLSLPLFLGKFVISVGKVAVNAICATLVSGETMLVGALGVSNNICGTVTNPTLAFEDSESSIVSQNLGNKNMKRTMKAFWVCAAYGAFWGILGFLLVRVFFLDQIVSLFLTAEEASVAYSQLIKSVFYFDCLSIPALTVTSIVLGLLYGYGQTFLATVNNIIRIATRIGVLLLFKYGMKIETVEDAAKAAGLSMGISNIAIGCFSVLILLIFLFQTKRKGYKGMRFSDPEPNMVEVDGVLMNEALIPQEAQEN